MTAAAMAKAQVTVEPGKQEIRITRLFNAPRELVYKAMTDPALIPQWYGPYGSTMTVDQMDVRKGGIWRFVERDAEGNEHPFSGVYHTIVPNEEIIQTFEYEPLPGNHVLLETLRLTDEGNQTRLNVISVFQCVEDRDGMVEAGMESGMQETYFRLDALLETLQQG